MKDQIRQLLLLLLLALSLAAFTTGCNTIEGAGDDIEQAGDEIEEATD